MTEEKVGGAVDVKVNALLCLIVTLLTEDTYKRYCRASFETCLTFCATKLGQTIWML